MLRTIKWRSRVALRCNTSRQNQSTHPSLAHSSPCLHLNHSKMLYRVFVLCLLAGVMQAAVIHRPVSAASTSFLMRQDGGDGGHGGHGGDGGYNGDGGNGGYGGHGGDGGGYGDGGDGGYGGHGGDGGDYGDGGDGGYGGHGGDGGGYGDGGDGGHGRHGGDGN